MPRKDKIYAEGVRQPLSKSLLKTAVAQFPRLGRIDTSGWTYEHRGTNYRDAKTDLTVYDETGKLVFRGRQFGNQVFFWDAKEEAAVG